MKSIINKKFELIKSGISVVMSDEEMDEIIIKGKANDN